MNDWTVQAQSGTWDSPMMIFRVLNFAPRRLKTLSQHPLRRDHVAIAGFRISAREADDEGNLSKLVVTSDVALNPAASTKYLSLSSLMALDINEMVDNFVSCNLSKEQTYFLEGLPLPQECHSENARDFLTLLVHCKSISWLLGYSAFECSCCCTIWLAYSHL